MYSLRRASYRNREFIDPTCYRSHSRLCNLLLKQGRIPEASRELAVRTLGSPAEQEKFYIEYEMHKELAGFYADQGRHNDLFYLLVRMGEMDKAVNILTGDDYVKIPEDYAGRVLDYVSAGRLVCAFERPPHAAAKFTHQANSFLTLEQQRRCEEWEAGYQIIHNWKGTETCKQLVELADTSIKQFLCLYVS